MAQRAKGSRQSATKNGPDSTKTSVGTLRERARNWVLTRGSPRLMMSMMLAATVGAGFLASVSMHRVGVHHPMLRYPLAVLVAWGMFLALVGIWVWWQRRQYDPSARSDGASWFSGRSSSSKSGSSWDLPSGSGSGGGSGGGRDNYGRRPEHGAARGQQSEREQYGGAPLHRRALAIFPLRCDRGEPYSGPSDIRVHLRCGRADANDERVIVRRAGGVEEGHGVSP